MDDSPGKRKVKRQASNVSFRESSCLSRRNSTISNKDFPHNHNSGNKNGVLSRESTRTETLVNIRSRSTTLYLSRSHSKVSQPGNVGSRGLFRESTRSSTLQHTPHLRSRQTTFEEEEADDLKKPKSALKKEFTFTGYDIMADCDPPDTPPTEPDEVERHEYVNVYINACKSLGLTPATFVTHCLMEPKFVMKSRSIGPQAAKALLIALVDNKRIRSLDLEDNWIGPEGAKAVAELLPHNSLLTEINISENRIGGEGMEVLADALRDNHVVRKLDVSGSDLRDHDAKYLADILENNVWLRELRASHNKFGEIGGLYLGPAIGNNDTLEVLDLSWNHLRRQGASAVAAGLEDNGGLIVLDLSWNGFSMTGCKVLGLSLVENYTLEELDLSCNRINAIAMGALLEGIRWNEGLTTIRLGQNPLTPDVALILLKTIEKSDKSVIKNVDLMDVVVDEEFVTTLQKMQGTRVLRARTGPIIRKGEGIINQEAGTFFTNNPLRAMFDYMNDRGYRVVDLFKRYDTDNTQTVTIGDFTKGLMNVHLPLTVGQIEDLVAELDTKKNGKIDLSYVEELFDKSQEIDSSRADYISFRNLAELEKTHRRKMFRQKMKVSEQDRPKPKQTKKKKKVIKMREKLERQSTRLPSIPDVELPKTR